jgi:hypothetical protein
LKTRYHYWPFPNLCDSKTRGNAMRTETISCTKETKKMATKPPPSSKGNFRDSDETAREKHPLAGDENIEDLSGESAGLQESSKTGKHSSVEKLAASRPEFGEGRGAQPVPGAFGNDESHIITGRGAAPATSGFRCSGCGRYFNTAAGLSAHEPECRLAKAATTQGRESLRREDSTSHAPNDAESTKR